MQIQLTGHHIDITDSLRDYVTSKFERLERHYGHLTDVHVVLTVEKLLHKAEATIMVVKGKIFADSESEDMYATIDTLVDKLDRQIKKYKEKNSDYRSTPIPSAPEITDKLNERR
ncbi:MAG: ribosomal subunit interface protein [Halothiobacillaceae bacterium]|nr:MAG: ribosomal subunit interface protein [Halothiobacillaceae bacterium]